MQPLFFRDDPQFWFETVRSFSHVAYGGADFDEVVSTSSRIEAGNYDSWHDEWLATAERVAADGERALAAGHAVTARDALLRASNYYRSAEFFLHGTKRDPRSDAAYQKSVTCFRTAASLFQPAIEIVEIPYEGTTLPGYFYRVDASGSARPTLVLNNGFDGTAEEMHFFGAAAAVERGYNVLTFDGPGQPGPMHREGLTFRPDWENVIGPVLDFLLPRREVEASRVALLGLSMGGLLAPRAAAFERRLAAVMAVDGVYDMAAITTGRFPGGRAEAEKALRAPSAPEVDASIEAMMAENSVARWAMHHGMWVMGASTPREYLAKNLDFYLGGGIAEKITCPTLVCSAADDLFFTGQPEALYEHLKCEKTFMEFTEATGGQAHCHVGSARLALGRILDWLTATLARR